MVRIHRLHHPRDLERPLHSRNNLLEYRLGSHPTNSSSTGLPALATAGTNGPVTNGLSTNGFTFSFPTVENVTYQPVANTNLSSTNWTDVGPLITGDGTVKSATDSSATNSTSKFYRVNLTPITNSTPMKCLPKIQRQNGTSCAYVMFVM